MCVCVCVNPSQYLHDFKLVVPVTYSAEQIPCTSLSRQENRARQTKMNQPQEKIVLTFHGQYKWPSVCSANRADLTEADEEVTN